MNGCTYRLSPVVKVSATEVTYMARVDVLEPSIELSEPVLVEGLPGVGLVGKIAADHLVDELGMTHYASLKECDGLPQMAMYDEGDYTVRPPVRFYADEERDLLVLQCDIPVPEPAAEEFAGCITDWFAESNITPLYISGLPTDEKAVPPELFGLATGGAESVLQDVGIEEPPEKGLVSGPTGALLARAAEDDLRAVGLIVESNERFPDPDAARILLKDAIQPIADIDVDLEALVEQASEIQEAKEELAQQLQEVTQKERTEAKPLRMYQ